MGVAIAKWFSSFQGIWGYKVFECATNGVGVIGKKCIGLGYRAPCWRIYAVFCVWDICRSRDQPSKLHRPPLHGLACSTTSSQRKNKITNPYNYNRFPSTAGLRKPYVPNIPSAPLAWPPKKRTSWWPLVVSLPRFGDVCLSLRTTIYHRTSIIIVW